MAANAHHYNFRNPGSDHIPNGGSSEVVEY
jgi:hypothetical protein